MTTSSTRTTPATSGLLIAVLALLTAVAPLATDMYLPAFPQMAADLDTTAASIQLTLTAFLVGLAVGQLLIGPISDAVGRRGPLILGTAICLLASIGCAVAPSVELLTAGRLLQGLSGAAGVVLARAIISDVSTGSTGAKLLGVMMIINVVAPVAAPLSGGAIISGLGWRGVFWVEAVLVAITLIGVLVLVKESLPAAQRNSGGYVALLINGRKVLSNRNYVGYLLTFCFAFAALFAYISASPFVLQNILGLSAFQFSLVFSANAVAIVVTSSIAAFLSGKVDHRKMVAGGLAATLVSAVVLLVLIILGLPMLPALITLAAFQGSLGFIFGNATALALEEAAAHAGTGSAFLGSLQFALAAVMSPLVGLAGEDSAGPMGIAMVVSAALAVLAFFGISRRHLSGVSAVGESAADASEGSSDAMSRV